MSENFGSGQPRVLNTEDRSIDNVVFQHKTPPLSSEWNLINQVSNQKTKDIVKSFTPSGWINVGDIKDIDRADMYEAGSVLGDVCTSINYNANTFKLISGRTGVTAFVNGWPIFVTGYNSSEENSNIEIDAPTADSYRYDFVFLEVWKKLIGKDDPIYPHGNTTATPYSDNELVSDAVGVETAKRTQIQYRIRTHKFTAVSNFKEGFDLGAVYPQGSRASVYQNSLYRFRAKGAEDVGLYISGSGSSVDQEILGTVDGFVYAIPMFMVYRRKQGSFNIGDNHATTTTRQKYLNGYRSDRPDGKLLDVIYSSDIVDNRHQIFVECSQAHALMNKTFKKLASGHLCTNLGKGFTNYSGGEAFYSGGTRQTKIEQINGIGGNDTPNLAPGESGSSPFKRKAYSNAAVLSNLNIIKIPVAASEDAAWSAGTFDLSSYIPSDSLAVITTVDGIYEPELGEVTNATYAISNKELTVSTGSNIIGTTKEVYLQVSLTYVPGNNGFRDVPLKVLEVNKSKYNPVSVDDTKILLRYNLTGSEVQFDTNGKDINDGETDERDFIQNESNNYTETVAFGVSVVIHRPIGVTPSQFTISLTDSKLYGYYILGVKSVYENVGTKENPDWELRTFNHIRDEISVSSDSEETEITAYRLNIYNVENTGAQEFKIALDVGSKRDYYKNSEQPKITDEVKALKFFKTNNQARGIIDVFEMVEVVALRDPGTDFFIADTVDKPIIKIISKAIAENDEEGGYETGVPYVYDSDGNFYEDIEVAGSTSINSVLPILSSSAYSTQKTPTRIKIQDTSSSITGDYIKVPLLVSSYVSANEQPYNFIYDFTPYQGLLSSTSVIKGNFVADGQALITSKGSGSEANLSLGSDTEIGGLAKFTLNNRFVQPIGNGSGVPDWTSYLDLENSRYYIKIKGDTAIFRIEKFASEVNKTGWIVLAQPFRVGSISPSPSGDEYEIIKENTPSDNVRNIIDRMPSFAYEDYKGSSTSLTISGVSSSKLFVDPLVRIHDPLQAVPGTFAIGSASNLNNQISRGVSDIVLSLDSKDDNFILPFKRPYIEYTSVSGSGPFYKKVFQPYLFLKIEDDKTVKPYMAVISSESSNEASRTILNNYTDKDTIDLFELLGRPLLKL